MASLSVSFLMLDYVILMWDYVNALPLQLYKEVLWGIWERERIWEDDVKMRMCKWGHKVWHEILSMRYWESTCHSVWQEIVEDQDWRIIKHSSFVEFSTPRGFLHVKLCLSHLWFIANLLVHICEFIMLWIIACYIYLKLSLHLNLSWYQSNFPLFKFCNMNKLR